MASLERVWTEVDNDPATTGAVLRRVLPESKHDVFLGSLRPSGDRFVDLRFKEQGGRLPTAPEGTQGLKVAVAAEPDGSVRILLSLANEAFREIFSEVIEDILELVPQLTPTTEASGTLGRVSAWIAFLKRRRDPMTLEEAAGLFAELEIMRTVVVPGAGTSHAAKAWTGPEGQPQDFQWMGGAVEVKSWRGKAVARPKISSEIQLDPEPSGRLWLAVVSLDQRLQGEGPTLADQVDRVHQLFNGDPGADADFTDKLLETGWSAAIAPVRPEHFTVHRVEIFEVTDGFPRIGTPLPTGVSNVTYRIDTSALASFRIELAELKLELDNA